MDLRQQRAHCVCRRERRKWISSRWSSNTSNSPGFHQINANRDRHLRIKQHGHTAEHESVWTHRGDFAFLCSVTQWRVGAWKHQQNGLCEKAYADLKMAMPSNNMDGTHHSLFLFTKELLCIQKLTFTWYWRGFLCVVIGGVLSYGGTAYRFPSPTPFSPPPAWGVSI